MKNLTVKINGETWKVMVISRAEFNRRYKIKKALAITHYRHNRKNPVREIIFSPQGLQISTIRHEVTHAYLSYHTLTALNHTDLEEFFADFVGARLRWVDRVSNRIFGAMA